jgi:hypothetical protein
MFVLAVLNASNSGDGVKGHVWSKQDKASAWVVALLLQLHGVHDIAYMKSLSRRKDAKEVPDRIVQVNLLCSRCDIAQRSQLKRATMSTLVMVVSFRPRGMLNHLLP